MDNLSYIIGQILGIVAVILGFASYQRKTQFGIIVLQCVTALTFSLHYFLISAPTAVALNFLSAVICIFFAFRNKKQGKNIAEVIIASVFIAFAGVLTWENIYSSFLMAGLVTSTVSLSFSNPQNTRRAMFIKSPLCLIYNIAVTSMGGIIYECTVIASAIIGLVKNKAEHIE